METPDTLTGTLPYAFVATIPAVALIYLLVRKRRHGHAKTRTCPHCRAMVGINESECGACHRKILFA